VRGEGERILGGCLEAALSFLLPRTSDSSRSRESLDLEVFVRGVGWKTEHTDGEVVFFARLLRQGQPVAGQ